MSVINPDTDYDKVKPIFSQRKTRAAIEAQNKCFHKTVYCRMLSRIPTSKVFALNLMIYAPEPESKQKRKKKSLPFTPSHICTYYPLFIANVLYC